MQSSQQYAELPASSLAFSSINESRGSNLPFFFAALRLCARSFFPPFIDRPTRSNRRAQFVEIQPRVVSVDQTTLPRQHFGRGGFGAEGLNRQCVG